jgi:3-hydroxyacyl-[acyl-carrier-protein] dehydratase
MLNVKLPTSPTEVAHWLPHRAPMLLIDRVLQADEKMLVAERTFGPETVFFQGHFPPPDEALLPGVVMLEGLAQAAALHTALSKNLRSGKATYRFTKADKVSWSAPVVPGQVVQIEIEKVKEKLGFLSFTGRALVGGVVCCTAHFMAKVTPQ